ncbi:nucleocapsid protein [memana virus]|uniref:Nucleocapsid n=1 Tax=memana virus TaxID=2940997 RepID=A0AAE9HWK8_9MONO|nr:nucleocapsid protein [memana virus]
MASLNDSIREFKQFKSHPPGKGALHSAFQGVKNKIIVLVPVGMSPKARWMLMFFLLQLVWSDIAPGSVITGALFSLLTIFSETPAQLIQAMIGDPDIEIQIIDVTDFTNGKPKLATRGLTLQKVEDQYAIIARTPPKGSNNNNPFVVKEMNKLIPRTVEELQISVGTVTLQIWILLAKAVTAPDTARDSEVRRWLKYTQQRRADKLYRLENKWCDNARSRIASDLPVRRLMVNILMEINSSTGVRGRIVEMIADVGSYIEEAGLAGFFTTVKYGIETRYSALALNELQADLSTVLGLMKFYRTLGEKAPYLVILEDSAQVKFAPGAYPLLYSYAMGIATALDRSMQGLVYDKNYLEAAFFRLGRSMVHHLEGNIDTKMAKELGLTEEQTNQLKQILRSDGSDVADGLMRKSKGSSLSADPLNINENIIPPPNEAAESEYETEHESDQASGATVTTPPGTPGPSYSEAIAKLRERGREAMRAAEKSGKTTKKDEMTSKAMSELSEIFHRKRSDTLDKSSASKIQPKLPSGSITMRSPGTPSGNSAVSSGTDLDVFDQDQ